MRFDQCPEHANGVIYLLEQWISTATLVEQMMMIVRAIQLALAILLALSVSGPAIAESQIEGNWGTTVRLTRGPSAVLNLTIESHTGCVYSVFRGVEYDTVNSIAHVSINSGPFDFGGCPFPPDTTLPIGPFESIGEYRVRVYDDPDEPLFQPANLLGELDEITLLTRDYANQVPVMPAYGLALLALTIVGLVFRNRHDLTKT